MSHELIDREYVYRGKILDLSKSRFMSEGKGEVEIEIVHHNGGAGILPLFDNGMTALVRQWRYPAGRCSLEIAAGRIERGHTPGETAARELGEELGYRASKLTWLGGVFVVPGDFEEGIFFFLATGVEESQQNLDDDEEIDVVQMPFDEALARVKSGEIDDAKSIIALFLAAPLVRQAEEIR